METNTFVVAAGLDGIAFFRLLQLRGAVSLEQHGMRHSSGRSAYALAKRVYGLKGSRVKVLAQLEAMVAAALEAKRANATEQS